MFTRGRLWSRRQLDHAGCGGLRSGHQGTFCPFPEADSPRSSVWRRPDCQMPQPGTNPHQITATWSEHLLIRASAPSQVPR